MSVSFFQKKKQKTINHSFPSVSLLCYLLPFFPFLSFLLSQEADYPPAAVETGLELYRLYRRNSLMVEANSLNSLSSLSSQFFLVLVSPVEPEHWHLRGLQAYLDIWLTFYRIEIYTKRLFLLLLISGVFRCKLSLGKHIVIACWEWRSG